MNKFAALSLIILSFSASSAQTAGKISGTVINKNGLPIPAVTISLLRSADSALVKAAISGKNGNYEFVYVKPGKYLVSASSAGLQKVFSGSFEISDKPVDLPAITLAQSVQKLSSVNVTTKRPFIETLLDKTVVNVDASPSNAGATVMDVLEKSPGIIVNNEDVISLMGKQGVIVMMDGKPSNLSGADLSNMLRNMPASALDQVEIMTNPSSKYDASGNSGIINLKTKKGRDPGINGSITTGISVSVNKFNDDTYSYIKSPASFNFNYRKNKINLFGNYNPNYYTGRNLLFLGKTFIDNQQVNSTSDQFITTKMKSLSHTVKAGLDWYPGRKNIFGFVLNGYFLDGSPKQYSSTTLKNALQQKQSGLNSVSENDLSFKNFSTNLNWKHTFDSAGRELTMDLDYAGYSNVSHLLLTTDLYSAAGQFINESLLRGNLPTDISIYSFKTDYTKPIKNGHIEMGIKSSYVRNDNIVNYERLENNTWKPDGSSNRFIYDEIINAAYLNLNKKINRWTLQGGLRLEHTVAKGEQVTANKDFKRDSLNLFPTVFIGYTVDRSNQFNFSYGRRISRPNYQDLNPFTYFIDSLSYRVGNPALKPQYSQNFEFGYLYKNKFNIKLNYTRVTDVISMVIAPDVLTHKTYITSKNVADFKNTGLAITLPIVVTKAWTANFFTNIFNNHYAGVYNSDTIDHSFTSFTVTLSNLVTINKELTAELSGFYRYRGIDGINEYEPTYQMSIALQKQVLKTKGTLRLSIRDPFAWATFETTSHYKDLELVHRGHADARQFAATFTYRFGKTAQQVRRRNSASQDEQNRVGQGM